MRPLGPGVSQAEPGVEPEEDQQPRQGLRRDVKSVSCLEAEAERREGEQQQQEQQSGDCLGAGNPLQQEGLQSGIAEAGGD